MNKELLIIFTRNPELGKVKTRLATSLGNSAALKVYTFLIDHTVSITKNLLCDKQVQYSEKVREDDVWDSNIFNKKQQVGEDLGIRMLNAFEQGFDKGYKKIIIIGSDMYDLSESDLEYAFSTLGSNDYVLGPAEDGGYYLLGMKKLKTELFKNKEWGTSTVLDQTMTHLTEESVSLLPLRNDIDIEADIENIQEIKQIIKE